MRDVGQPESDEEEMKQFMKPRPISDRFLEQIAEDVVWDIIDEATFFVMDEGK
jgi:COMPASS component BRE2